jgi:hypothetical protein
MSPQERLSNALLRLGTKSVATKDSTHAIAEWQAISGVVFAVLASAFDGANGPSSMVS